MGKNILEWTISQARNMGYTTMKLYTSNDPNEAIAQNLYESLGFKLIGEEDDPGKEYKILYREKTL